jgi:hypothetical protein
MPVERLSESDHLQWAKQLNHEYQLAKQEKRRKEQIEKVAKKASEMRVSLLQILEQNAECEKEMLAFLGKQNSDGNGVLFGNITLENLEKTKCCTIAHLQGFIHARMWNGPKPKGSANWPKKKGKASDGNGERSYISWAYELRNSSIVLVVPEESADDVEMVDNDVAAAPPPTVKYMGRKDNFPNPSEYLDDSAWVEMVGETFEGSFDAVTDEIKMQADDLYSRLLQNLGSHIQKKVDKSKRCHFTLRWSRQNLSQFAAIVTLAGHVRDEPSIVGDKECLLKNPVGSKHRCVLVDNEFTNPEGCYIYYDTVNGEWIRSGKVAGTCNDHEGMMDRHKEHLASAARNDNSSSLYIQYPAKSSSLATTVQSNNIRPYPWQAYFEDLEIFCRIGFICSDIVQQRLTADGDSDDSPKGIFVWDKACIDSLNKCGKGGVTTLKDKQLHMVAYLLELGYELMLSAKMDVSTMPGFEKFGLPNLYKK